jgi:uncharacterized protein YchJ
VKIGRDEPCWCGSGIKYKKCHLNRAEEEKVQPWEAAKAMRDKFSQRICSAPDSMRHECSRKIVKAHTVPKSMSLKAIAINGHVLGFKIGLENFHKHNGKLQPEPIGINNASTFTGFCQKHDDYLFSCLEKDDFRKSDKQCFMLAYRSFSREYYTKAALVDMYEVNASLDNGRPIEGQVNIQEQAYLMDMGASLGLRDNLFHKEKFDKCIELENYKDIQAVIFEYIEPFPIQSSGSVNPDFDFDNIKIQDLSDFEAIPDMLSVTSFYDRNKSYIALSWLNHCKNSCTKLVNSLLDKPETELSFYLAQYIFSNFENFFLSLEWWDSLSAKDKDVIVHISHDNVSTEVDPHGRSISKTLLECSLPSVDSIHYVNWKYNA